MLWCLFFFSWVLRQVSPRSPWRSGGGARTHPNSWLAYKNGSPQTILPVLELQISATKPSLFISLRVSFKEHIFYFWWSQACFFFYSIKKINLCKQLLPISWTLIYTFRCLCNLCFISICKHPMEDLLGH